MKEYSNPMPECAHSGRVRDGDSQAEQTSGI